MRFRIQPVGRGVTVVTLTTDAHAYQSRALVHSSGLLDAPIALFEVYWERAHQTAGAVGVKADALGRLRTGSLVGVAGVRLGPGRPPHGRNQCPRQPLRASTTLPAKWRPRWGGITSLTPLGNQATEGARALRSYPQRLRGRRTTRPRSRPWGRR